MAKKKSKWVSSFTSAWDDTDTTNNYEKVQTEVGNLKKRLAAAGEDADTSSPNLLTTLLENLSRLGYGGLNFVREFTNPSAGATPGVFDPTDAFWRGLSLSEKTRGKDIATDFGFSTDPWFKAKLGPIEIAPNPAGAVGLVIDLLNPADPLNWIAPGVGKAGKFGAQAITKGMPLLEKTFGKEAALELASKLGTDSAGNYNKWLTNLGQLTKEGNVSIPTVGALVDHVAARANSLGIEQGINPEAISEIMLRAMEKKGLKAGDRAQERTARALKLGLQIPIINQKLGSVDLPGSQSLMKLVDTIAEKGRNTSAGQALGQAFSTTFSPNTVPASVWTRLIRKGATRPDIDLDVLNNMQGMPGWELREGSEVYKEVKEGLAQTGTRATVEEQKFQQVVDRIFKGTSDQDRKDILRAAIYGHDLEPRLQPALTAFRNWRQRVVDTYRDLGVTFTPLEDYVPFVTTGKPLSKAEMGMLRGIFGTGIKKIQSDDFLSMLSKTDPNLIPRTTKAMDPAEINKLLGREWLTEDAAVAMARRGVKAVRGQEATRFLQEMSEKYGMEIEDLTKLQHLPPGYVLITPRVESSGRVLLDAVKKEDTRAFALPEEFAKAYNEYTDLMFNPESQNKLMQFLDASTRAYKTMAYMWNPGHIPRDAMSNIFNLWLMGVRNPASYVKGLEVLRNVARNQSKNVDSMVEELINPQALKLEGEATETALRSKLLQGETEVPEMVRKAEEVVLKTGKPTISTLEHEMGLGIPEAKRLLNELEARGVITPRNELGKRSIIPLPDEVPTAPRPTAPGAQANTDMQLNFPKWQGTANEFYGMMETLGLLDSGAVLNEFIQAGSDWSFRMGGKYTDLMRKATRVNDNWARVAGAIDLMEKGYDPVTAAQMVKKFLFDYNDLTSFEKRFMKRIVPFYTWMRKNIPLQVEQVFKQPGKFATMGKLQTGIGEEPQEGEAPSFIAQSGGFKMSGPGGKGGAYIIPNLSYADLGKVPMSVEGLRELLANVNPFIRAVPEMAANTQFFSGQPIEQYAGEREKVPFAYWLEKAIGKETPPVIPSRTVGYLLNQIPILRTLSTISNPEHPRQTARLVSVLGGPQIYPEAWAKEAATYESRDKLRALVRSIENQGKEVPTVRDLKTPSIGGTQKKKKQAKWVTSLQKNLRS